MQQVFRIGGVALLVLCGLAALGGAKTGPVKLQLTNGAPSVDVLLDEFVAAVSAKDEAGLHRLRLTEAEYRDIIIPGTVKEGEPLRKVDATPSEFFWRMLNQKSEDVGHVIIERFGGQHYKRKDVTFTKGVRTFALYKAIGEVRLNLEDEQGVEKVLPTGTIAEVNGRFKFIGYNFNN